MKNSAGFTRLSPSLISLVAMVAGMVLLSMAMQPLPLAFLFGIVVLGEEASVARIAAAVLIVSGLVLMKLSDTSA